VQPMVQRVGDVADRGRCGELSGYQPMSGPSMPMSGAGWGGSLWGVRMHPDPQGFSYLPARKVAVLTAAVQLLFGLPAALADDKNTERNPRP
jgi:hypothetical protein